MPICGFYSSATPHLASGEHHSCDFTSAIGSRPTFGGTHRSPPPPPHPTTPPPHPPTPTPPPPPPSPPSAPRAMVISCFIEFGVCFSKCLSCRPGQYLAYAAVPARPVQSSGSESFTALILSLSRSDGNEPSGFPNHIRHFGPLESVRCMRYDTGWKNVVSSRNRRDLLPIRAFLFGDASLGRAQMLLKEETMESMRRQY